MNTLFRNMKASVRVETVTGPERSHGPLTVTPVARSLTVGRTVPGRGEAGEAAGGAAFARAWPSAVLVSSGGETSRLRIVDVTRLAQLTIVLVALIALYEMLTRSKKRKERS
jgi:hypothetical protein